MVALDAAQAYLAPELIVADETAVWRYRLRTQAERPPARDGVVRPARRWQTLDRIAVGTAAVQALTEPPVPADHPVGVERAVLSFRGDQVTLLRSTRIAGGRHALALETLALPTGRPRAPEPVAEAVGWLDLHFPGLVDGCVREPQGALERVGRRWLVLGGGPGCPDALHAFAIGPTQAPTPSPDGRFRLDVRGVAAPPPVLRTLTALDDCCAPGAVWLDGPRGAVRLGPAHQLDGLRWVGPDDPVVALVDSYFQPIGAGPCGDPLRLGEARTRANLCQVDEAGRAWGGPSDLSARVRAERTSGALRLDVVVTDPDRGAGDRVVVWLGGDGRRALEFAVGADGFEARGRGPARRRVRAIDARWTATAGGYRIAAEIPWALVGTPPAVTVAVDDDDGAGVVRLWAAGARVDDRNRAPTPVAL